MKAWLNNIEGIMNNQIYNVGHQTLDVSKSKFLNYVIDKEDLARTNLFRKGKIHRGYDPVLQIEERDECFVNDRLSTSKATQGMKEALLTKFRNSVDVLNEDVAVLSELELKKKRLRKELHKLEASVGIKGNMRDFGMNMDLEKVRSKVIPESSSYFKDSQIIHDKHRKYQMKKLAEMEFQHSLHKTKMKSNGDATHRGFGGDARSTFKDTYPTFENQNLIQSKSTQKSVYQNNVDEYTNKTILYNQLLAPPRKPRSTLLLSGMGFDGHCTEHAMEVIRILHEKHL